ncbi:MAG: hypothetical protein A2W90_02935 [Bacteroidetes bacterium GWF2_42_66]|nr:MAG: hypothetical protein A2W92_10325 [Bacteroidetes bacterium GWA2_42_15]OFY01300.1 MAG: hypothetical protein A2W89_16420 [Bacteroidetes bacterium GWE2_42_39]OFY42144.1 MAG: hypothetical protein A2W90_02935 [Bacteroidetes bacterium GWF2_42_66]HBL77651.1 hypothetical protein [Prolixibacteraceae bacterium]HCB62780.1 hypothetical protein [Bacteroidales bacterium]
MKIRLISLLLIGVFLSCEKDDYSLAIKACFDYQFSSTNDGEVQFTNCSENATSFLWLFGDGTTSTEKDPLHVYEIAPPYLVALIATNRNRKDTLVQRLPSDIMVLKPNIYVYPTRKIDLCLKINFPLGGNIIESIPQYNQGWCVHVDTTGKIDNQYSYLFYESKQPDVFQYKKGWCITRANLKSFFEENMSMYNFSQQEIKDFTDYWISLLIEDNYYNIYPQTNAIIDTAIQLDFSVQPDNVGRLFYGIVGVNKYQQIDQPMVVPFLRNDFYIMEWGVIRK